jgi:biopolymer transport protein ExbD
MAGMSDIVFLLLIFFMITSTLIHPTALKLMLPRGNEQNCGKTNNDSIDNTRFAIFR